MDDGGGSITTGGYQLGSAVSWNFCLSAELYVDEMNRKGWNQIRPRLKILIFP